MDENLSVQRKKLFNSVCGILLGYWGIMLVSVVLASLAIILSSLARENVPGETLLMEQIANSGIGYLMACGFCVIMLGIWKGWRFFPETFKSKRNPSAWRFFQLICLFMGGQLFGSLCTLILEKLLNLFGLTALQAIVQASGQSNSLSMFLYVSFAAPVVEELLFRGAVLRSFAPLGKRFSSVMSAFLFALFHGNVAQIPFAFVIGLILSYVATEYGLVWCILLHCINNFVFAQLLAPYEVLSGILCIILAIFAIGIVILKRKSIRNYISTLEPAPNGCMLDFFKAPVSIILIIVCAINALVMIQLI